MGARDLRSELTAIDPGAELLAENSQTSWWRTGFGILGLAGVDEEGITRGLSEITRGAYTLLDFLPEAKLPTSDLWNLTLVLAVPWTAEEAIKDSAVYGALEAATHDTTGARKVVMWSNERLRDHFGRLTTATAQPRGLSWNDPLREEIASVSRDAEERTALEVLFKRKLTQDDIDGLVHVLGREK